MKHLSPFILFLILSCLFNYSQAQTYQVTVSNLPFIFLEDPQVAVEGAWTDPDISGTPGI